MKVWANTNVDTQKMKYVMLPDKPVIKFDLSVLSFYRFFPFSAEIDEKKSFFGTNILSCNFEPIGGTHP